MSPVRPGTVLFMGHALLSWCLISVAGAVAQGGHDEAFGCGVLLWLALGLWGLIHAGSLLYRAAYPARCPHCHAAQGAS